MSEKERLQKRIAEFKEKGQMPTGFSIPPVLAALMTEDVAAQVDKILDRHIADAAKP